MAAITVTDTAQELAGVAGTNSEFLIQNLGPDPVWLGTDNSVSDATGLKLETGDVLTTSDGVVARNLSPLWLVCAAGETADVRWLRTA